MPARMSARMSVRTSAGWSAQPCRPSPSQLARNRQGRYQLAAVALGAQLRRQLIRDVPGEDDGAIRLVGEQTALLDHRDRRPGHAFADLERARDLADIV